MKAWANESEGRRSKKAKERTSRFARLLLFATAAALAASTAPVDARSRLELRISRYFLPAGSDFSVVVWVEPHEENRELTVFVDSPDYFRSSMEPLEGADAARTHQFHFKSLPAGQYSLVARLEGTKGVREVTSSEFTVGLSALRK
jgi:hypothetical protein